MHGFPPLAAAAGQSAVIPLIVETSCPDQGSARARPALALVATHPEAAALRRHDTEEP